MAASAKTACTRMNGVKPCLGDSLRSSKSDGESKMARYISRLIYADFDRLLNIARFNHWDAQSLSHLTAGADS